MIEIIKYDNLRLLICISFTLIAFSWIFRIKTLKIKMWYSLLVGFLLIYSGIGSAILEVRSGYLWFYIFYIWTLSIVLKYFYERNELDSVNVFPAENGTDDILRDWIDRNGLIIILVYVMLLISDLVYPTNRLMSLVNPPSPSLEDLHYKTYIIGDTKDSVSQILYLLQQFVAPFFYLSLYKFRHNYLAILILLFLPVYIDLCNRGIIGRGESAIPLLILFLFIFERIPRKRRKTLVLVGLCAFPFICYLAVWFSFIRIGADMINISVADSVNMLFGQEVSYPKHYNDYIDKASGVSVIDYLMWITLLPLPGFLKFGFGDPQVNLKFTMMVTGMDPSQSTFSICLPGLVGESIIVFGSHFFFMHAIILGCIVSMLIKYLSKYDTYSFLFLYVSLIFSYKICRGGTAAAYSFAFKQFIIFLLFVYYKTRKKSLS